MFAPVAAICCRVRVPGVSHPVCDTEVLNWAPIRPWGAAGHRSELVDGCAAATGLIVTVAAMAANVLAQSISGRAPKRAGLRRWRPSCRGSR